jgi:predicted enzyme related to lactoylglutathione lyase
MTDQSTSAGLGVEGTVARPGGVSYLRIPARDLARSAQFYHAVFG